MSRARPGTIAAPLNTDRPAAQAPNNARGIHAILVVLLVCFALFGTIHAFTVPTGATGYQDAPDEAAHVTYIRALAAGVYPSRAHPASPADGRTPFAYEWHQPPLYYLFALPFYELGGAHGARFASVLFGLCGILLVFAAGRLIYPADPAVALLAAAFAALIPGHMAICSTVNNDSLLELCFSGTLVVLLCAFLQGFTLRRACLLGASIGCAMITKLTGLLLIPIAAAAMVYMARQGANRRALLQAIGASAAVAAGIAGWWFVRNAVLYGQPVPIAAFNRSFSGTMQASTMVEAVGGWGAYLQMMGQGTFCSFWAVYGTAAGAAVGRPSFLPLQVYLLTAIITAGAAAGLARLHFTAAKSMSPAQIAGVRILLATFAVVALAFVLFILKYFQMQGRYLYPAILPISVILALGWRGIVPDRYFRITAVGIAGLLLVLNVLFLHTIVPN